MRVSNTVNVISDDELRTFAREFFNENYDQISRDVELIREWINSTPHMNNVRQDDEFLHMFLRGCNYDVAATKEKLDKFFTVRSLVPEWFDNWNPSQSNLEEIWKAGIFLPLRGFDKHGRYVILVRTGHVVPSSMKIDDCWKAFIMMFALCLEGNIQANTKGFVLLLDEEKITASHVLMMTPTTLKKLMLVFQEAYPLDNTQLIDLSMIYFQNMPKILKTFLNLFFSFLNEKYRKIVRVHSSSEGCSALREELGEDVLPAEYGGSNSDVSELTNFWRDKLVEQTEWLTSQTTLKTNESLRKGKSKMKAELGCSLM